MQVNGLDHVNIITDDLEGTAGFYETLMGLRRGESPGAAMGMKGAWMFDAADNAIVHLMWRDPSSQLGAGHVPGAVTGAVHHVAFRCQGFAATIERLKAMGREYRVNDRMHAGLRQIFVSDPNNISLELNFPVE